MSFITSKFLVKFKLLAAIGRTLVGKEPFETKVCSLIPHLKLLLGNRAGVATWIETDNKVFGEISKDLDGAVFVKDIRLENIDSRQGLRKI